MFGNADAKYIVDPAADGSYSFEWTGSPVDMAFKSITSTEDNHVFTGGDAFTDGVDYIVRYFVDNGNEKFDAKDTQLGDGTTAPSEVGGYWIVALTENAKNAWKAGSWNLESLVNQPGVIAQYFDVTARSLEGLQAVDNGNAADTTFTYKATKQTVDFALDGKVLDTDDYSVTIVEKATGKDVTGAVIDAGDYEATVIGNKGYSQDEVKVPFTVEPLDLSTAEIYTADFAKGGKVVSTTINGVDMQKFVDAGAVACAQTKYQGADGKTYAKTDSNFHAWNNADEIGGYYMNVEPVATSKNMVQGKSAEYKINVVTALDEDFLYDGEDFADIAGAVFDLSKGEAELSNGKTVEGWDASLVTNESLEDTTFTVAPETADAPGAYTATARVDVPSDYSVGGSVRAAFSVVKGILDPDTVDVVVAFNGLNFDLNKGTYKTTYTGQPVVPAISVKDDGKALVAGADYTVTYTEDASGDAVESMVDAGKYTVTIELAEGYVFGGATTGVIAKFGVEIAPRAFTSVSVVTPMGTAGKLLYTGSAIDPQFKGAYTDALGNPKTVVLDPSWYEVSGIRYANSTAEAWETVKEIVEAGKYQIDLTRTDACKNYTWADQVGKITIEVADAAYFTDVASDAWYAEEVALAAQNRYVSGVGDRLFMPNAKMTREQFATVLAKMAGETWFPGTYPTKFTDVSADSWSAYPVLWATNAEVVYGTSDTTFSPFDNITREQIASMLYRYAGNGAEADLSALDAFVDGDQVSDWAAEAMAWAVENGYMSGTGEGQLSPQGIASRAEVAALAVRVQPAPVEKPIA